MDTNNDEKVTRDEVEADLERTDTNQDGKITETELADRLTYHNPGMPAQMVKGIAKVSKTTSLLSLSISS